MFLFAVVTLCIVGVSLVWAARVLYGNVRDGARATLPLVLHLGGWVLILIGASLFTTIGFLIALVIFGMVVARFRFGERRALLWMLSMAAEKGLPLSQSVRAFACRRSDEMARRALALADLLDAGVPLPKALRQSRNALPLDTELLVSLSTDPAATAAALRASGEVALDADEAWSPILGHVAYLLLVGFLTVVLYAFILIKIMPTYRQILLDFGLDVPPVTELFIQVGVVGSEWLFLPSLLGIYVFGALLVAAFFYARGRIWLPPPLPWFFGRTDRPAMLRGLAICVGQQLPMHEGLRRLAAHYPVAAIGSRLANCSGAVAVGADWCAELMRHDLISSAEAGVLRAAQAAGNLEWALEELASVATRKMVYRAKTTMSVFSAVSLLCIAVPAALLAFGSFVPLVRMISEAANVSI